MFSTVHCPGQRQRCRNLLIHCITVALMVSPDTALQVRILVLYHHGGMWMDNDVIFFQDVSHLLLTSYQFVMRWTNNHILRVAARSPLATRIMEVASTMPFDTPNFEEEIINKRCKPVDYRPAHRSYEFQDVYNTCLYRLVLKVNNTGPADAVLYDQPLGEHLFLHGLPIVCVLPFPLRTSQALRMPRWHMMVQCTPGRGFR